MDFSTEIVNWYGENKRHLPWRATKDPYKIWLSEIILQQTRIEQGLPYYVKFITAYPTVFHLADAADEEVLKLWQGLGYYNRARHLHATARYVAGTLQGIFPKTYKELLTLKGVGDYTASAIASICYGEAAPVVDGNVYRVLSRYFGVETPINSGKGITYFKTLAKALIQGQEPSVYNQAIMEFGAIQCKPKAPNCTICPLNTTCTALQKNKVAELPVKLDKGKTKKRFFNYLVVTDGVNILLEKRTAKDIWRDLYEFPLIETSEVVEEHAITQHTTFRNLVKDNTFEIALYNRETIVHKLSHQHIHTKFWMVNTADKIKNGKAVSTLKNYPVPVLIANFIEKYNF